MKKTASIRGTKIVLDVPTKCLIVEEVLNKTFKTKEDQLAFIESLAQQCFVNPVTIKFWCNKYQNTYKLGKLLPKGTMSFAFSTVPDDKLPTTIKQLEDLRKILSKLAIDSQTCYHSNLKSSDFTNTKPSKEILDKLITAKV